MFRNNNAAKERDAQKRREDDKRADRITAAEVRSAGDVCLRAYREYYEIWLFSLDPKNGIDSQWIADRRGVAKSSNEALTLQLLKAEVVLNSEELVTLGREIESNQREFIRKMDLYEQGLAIRLPHQGSTDLLFDGLSEAVGNYVEAIRRVTRERDSQ